jgi:hypothetical protein
MPRKNHKALGRRRNVKKRISQAKTDQNEQYAVRDNSGSGNHPDHSVVARLNRQQSR